MSVGKKDIQQIYENLNQYGRETRAILQVEAFLHPQLQNSTPTFAKFGDYIGEQLGNTRFYECTLPPERAAARAVTLAGAAVVTRTRLSVPFAHKLLTMELYHTTALFVASIAAYRVILAKLAGSIANLPYMALTLYDKPDIAASSFIATFYDYENISARATWAIDFYGTDTELIYPCILIEHLGGEA